MVKLLEQIGELGWGNAVICFVLIICIVVTGISGYRKLLSVLGLRSTKSIKEDETENRLNKMQKQIDAVNEKMKKYQTSLVGKQEEYHKQSIEIRSELKDGQDGLKEDIYSLKQLLQQFMGDQNKSTIAILRSSLWRLHKDFVSQGFVTPDGLKTFMEMGKTYESAGGDDIYHEKLLPEVEELDIHYPNGSIYNPEPKTEHI